MKTHEIGGNFVQKYFEGRAKEAKVEFFSNLEELRFSPLTIRVIADNGEEKVFPYTVDKLFANAYRGFSLQHQGGSEGLSAEEKAERKEVRKAKNETIRRLLASLAKRGKTPEHALAEIESL